MVPLFVIYAHKARAANPGGVGVRELFTRDPDAERDYFPVRSILNRVILWIERGVRPFEPLIPGWVRKRALKRAEEWFTPRCNEGGLGAIFPAMIATGASMVWSPITYPAPRTNPSQGKP